MLLHSEQVGNGDALRQGALFRGNNRNQSSWSQGHVLLLQGYDVINKGYSLYKLYTEGNLLVQCHPVASHS